jgi:hypothetical protein
MPFAFSKKKVVQVGFALIGGIPSIHLLVSVPLVQVLVCNGFSLPTG